MVTGRLYSITLPSCLSLPYYSHHSVGYQLLSIRNSRSPGRAGAQGNERATEKRHSEIKLIFKNDNALLSLHLSLSLSLFVWSLLGLSETLIPG